MEEAPHLNVLKPSTQSLILPVRDGVFPRFYGVRVSVGCNNEIWDRIRNGKEEQTHCFEWHTRWHR